MSTFHFAVSGIDTYLWLPPLAGLLLAFLCSMVGISGAAWRYQREKWLWWRLAPLITVGGTPGTWLGAWIRSHYLSARGDFEIFVAAILCYGLVSQKVLKVFLAAILLGLAARYLVA